MKICIPTTKNEGMQSLVYGHFGSAPCFLIYDTENSSIKSLDNQDQGHEHGKCNPLQSFQTNPIDVMITGGIGTGALLKLKEKGIKAYRAKTSSRITEIIDAFSKNLLPEITINNTCQHHGHHDHH